MIHIQLLEKCLAWLRRHSVLLLLLPLISLPSTVCIVRYWECKIYFTSHHYYFYKYTVDKLVNRLNSCYLLLVSIWLSERNRNIHFTFILLPWAKYWTSPFLSCSTERKWIIIVYVSLCCWRKELDELIPGKSLGQCQTEKKYDYC